MSKAKIACRNLWKLYGSDPAGFLRRHAGTPSIETIRAEGYVPAVRDVRHRITKALHQNADVDARHISVEVSGSTATLTGTVGSWLQRESAERAAASAPGIARVENHIHIESMRDANGEAHDTLDFV